MWGTNRMIGPLFLQWGKACPPRSLSGCLPQLAPFHPTPTKWEYLVVWNLIKKGGVKTNRSSLPRTVQFWFWRLPGGNWLLQKDPNFRLHFGEAWHNPVSSAKLGVLANWWLHDIIPKPDSLNHGRLFLGRIASFRWCRIYKILHPGNPGHFLPLFPYGSCLGRYVFPSIQGILIFWFLNRRNDLLSQKTVNAKKTNLKFKS